MTQRTITKKVILDLTELDANAYGMIAAFRREARHQEWKKHEIDTVVAEMTSGDYDHAIQTLMKYTEQPEDEEYGDEDDEE